MRYTLHKKPKGIAVIAFEGSPNVYELDDFKKGLDAILKDVSRCRRLIIDFSGTQVMDELALGIFVVFSRNYRSQGGELRLIGLNHTLKNLFDYSLLTKVYAIHNSAQEAARTFDYTA